VQLTRRGAVMRPASGSSALDLSAVFTGLAQDPADVPAARSHAALIVDSHRA
jgi:hypothetical protein